MLFLKVHFILLQLRTFFISIISINPISKYDFTILIYLYLGLIFILSFSSLHLGILLRISVKFIRSYNYDS